MDNPCLKTVETGAQVIEGSKVFLNSSCGEIERVLVKDIGEVLLVCREEEWKRARKAGELPVSVGFKKTDLIKLQQGIS